MAIRRTTGPCQAGTWSSGGNLAIVKWASGHQADTWPFVKWAPSQAHVRRAPDPWCLHQSDGHLLLVNQAADRREWSSWGVGIGGAYLSCWNMALSMTWQSKSSSISVLTDRGPHCNPHPANQHLITSAYPS